MHPLRRLAVIGLAVTCLCLTACVFSEHPLSDPATAATDDDLIGLWTREENGETYILAIGRPHEAVTGMPKGVMTAARIEFRLGGGLTSEEAKPAFFVSTIGKEKFLNDFPTDEAIRTVTKDGKTTKVWDAKGIKRYGLCKYEVKDDKLTMWVGSRDPDRLAKLIDDGKVAGEVKREGGRVMSVKLTATTAELDKFIRGGGSADLFPDPDDSPLNHHANKVVYRRMKVTK